MAGTSATIDAVMVLDPAPPVEGSAEGAAGVPAVRRAMARDVDAMAAQLARTFCDDPVTCHIFPRARGARPACAPYFGTQMRADYLPFGGCYTTEGYAGSAVWAPAGKPLLTRAHGDAHHAAGAALRGDQPASRRCAS